MAVKVFCSACDTFIKDVETGQLQKLTGNEKCDECGDKIRELYKILDDKIKDFITEIDRKLVLVKKKFDGLDAAHGKFLGDAQSLHRTTKVELDTHLQSILQAKSTRLGDK